MNNPTTNKETKKETKKEREKKGKDFFFAEINGKKYSCGTQYYRNFAN